MDSSSGSLRRRTGIRPGLAVLSLLISAAVAASAFAAGYEAIEIVPTRPDVTVRLLVIKANAKPSSSPSTTYISQSGRLRSSRLECSRAISCSTWAMLPGLRRVRLRTW